MLVLLAYPLAILATIAYTGDVVIAPSPFVGLCAIPWAASVTAVLQMFGGCETIEDHYAICPERRLPVTHATLA